MSDLISISSLGSVISLTALETVLGIDNVIFLSILVSKLPRAQQGVARRLGLIGALGMRIGLLFTLSYFANMTKPFFTVPVIDKPISGRDLVLLIGGGFLIAKSTFEVFSAVETGDKQEEEHHDEGKAKSAFLWILVQIIVMDIVFSLDSVITAVGLAPHIVIMITAMICSMIIMLWFAKPIGDFVEAHPSMKVLALSFLIMIGTMLVAEGGGQHINKGYVYFAMAFSVGVEMLNIRLRKKAQVGANEGEEPAKH